MNLFLLLVLGALWGTSYLFIKVTVAEVPAMTLVAGRLLFAAIVLWILQIARRQKTPRDFAAWRAYTVMGLLSGVVPYGLISWGEQHISSGLASLLQSTMPLFTVILAHFVTSDERISPARALGVTVGFSGVAVLMIPELSDGLRADFWGQAAIIGSSLTYAAATIFARRHLRGHSPLAASTGQLTTGALFAVPVAFIVDRPLSISPSLPATASWLGLVLLGTVAAYILYYALLERTGATFVSTVTYIIPINGLLWGAVILGEPLSARILTSSALILLGVLLVRR
jgi:drug/metabolite transporter (DMT)-like permease